MVAHSRREMLLGAGGKLRKSAHREPWEKAVAGRSPYSLALGASLALPSGFNSEQSYLRSPEATGRAQTWDLGRRGPGVVVRQQISSGGGGLHTLTEFGAKRNHMTFFKGSSLSAARWNFNSPPTSPKRKKCPRPEIKPPNPEREVITEGNNMSAEGLVGPGGKTSSSHCLHCSAASLQPPPHPPHCSKPFGEGSSRSFAAFPPPSEAAESWEKLSREFPIATSSAPRSETLGRAGPLPNWALVPLQHGQEEAGYTRGFMQPR